MLLSDALFMLGNPAGDVVGVTSENGAVVGDGDYEGTGKGVGLSGRLASETHTVRGRAGVRSEAGGRVLLGSDASPAMHSTATGQALSPSGVGSSNGSAYQVGENNPVGGGVDDAGSDNELSDNGQALRHREMLRGINGLAGQMMDGLVFIADLNPIEQGRQIGQGTSVRGKALPSGNKPCVAYAINADGDIAGWATNSSNQARAAWWHYEGSNTWSGPYFVPYSGQWTVLNEARGISNRSAGDVSIAGWGSYTLSGSNATRAFVTSSARPTITVYLQSIVAAAPAQTITFVLRDAGGTAYKTETHPVSASGTAVTLDNYVPSTDSVHIKGAKWLAKNVTFTTGTPSPTSVTLPAGDGNNDNAVDVSDYLLILNHYNQTVGNPNYLDAADYNCDGANDSADLLIVVNNYNTIGDP